MQPAIDRAIERGVAFLRSTRMLDGSWGQHQGAHFGGQTALSFLTLIKARVSVDDPAITAALDFLRANGSESTYGTGCLLMALEALGDDGLKPWATELAEQLMGTQGGYDNAGKHDGMWTYPLQPNTTVCLSNTQYAILGLRSAQRMGVNISARVFRKTLDDLPLYVVESERPRGRIGAPSYPCWRSVSDLAVVRASQKIARLRRHRPRAIRAHVWASQGRERAWEAALTAAEGSPREIETRSRRVATWRLRARACLGPTRQVVSAFTAGL